MSPSGTSTTVPSIQRRGRLDFMQPVELAVHLAQMEIDRMPADVRLTTAQNLLFEVRDWVADFIEGVDRPERTEVQVYNILQNHCGERGESEGAVETLQRIIRERNLSTETKQSQRVARAHAEFDSTRHELRLVAGHFTSWKDIPRSPNVSFPDVSQEDCGFIARALVLLADIIDNNPKPWDQVISVGGGLAVVDVDPEVRAAIDELGKIPEFARSGLPDPDFRGWTVDKWNAFSGGLYINTADGHSAKAIYGCRERAQRGRDKLRSMGIDSVIMEPQVPEDCIWKVLFDGRDLVSEQ